MVSVPAWPWDSYLLEVEMVHPKRPRSVGNGGGVAGASGVRGLFGLGMHTAELWPLEERISCGAGLTVGHGLQ